MSRVLLLNSNIMVAEGTYVTMKASIEEVKRTVNAADEVISYIGYPDTAKFMSELLGIDVPVNRGIAELKDGDIMVVCKLKYRVQNPADKGKFVPKPDDIEWWITKYTK